MSYIRKDPLRAVSDEEREILSKVARASSERADRVRRAKALLAVADGKSYVDAASNAGFKANDSVSLLVSKFNECGLDALDSSHGGGPAKKYGEVEKSRILLEVAREPELEKDGTATWSLTLLQRALRSADDGLPNVSTYTIHQTLREAGYSWQRTRTWCSTGSVKRKRKGGVVTVTDTEAEEKRGN
ncbi:MAG: helix-turn-helix domain containing protein [Armatimonadetes bacterium]|nr:helix-turn-helix domain containing protein [Armatimonadota bacterium]